MECTFYTWKQLKQNQDQDDHFLLDTLLLSVQINVTVTLAKLPIEDQAVSLLSI